MKHYGSLRALDELSLELESGECYALLGPNGAGKSTAIGVLSTLLPYQSGSVWIDGKSLERKDLEIRKKIGVVSQEIALYEDLSARENLLFWGGLYDMDRRELQACIQEALKFTGLEDRASDKVANFSGGMKRRLHLAAAILHSPKLLFLDEPTVGIDPQSRNKIYELIEWLKSGGMTILYTTHYMQEVEKLCDRIGIIDEGKILDEGDLQSLRNKHGNSPLMIFEIDGFEGPYDFLNHRFGSNISWTSQGFHLQTERLHHDLNLCLSLCEEAQLGIRHMGLQESGLEQIFLKLTGKALRD